VKERSAEDDLAHQVAAELLRMRHELGLTQEQVARRMGASVSLVVGLEHAAHAPTGRTIERLSRALGARPELRFVRDLE